MESAARAVFFSIESAALAASAEAAYRAAGGTNSFVSNFVAPLPSLSIRALVVQNERKSTRALGQSLDDLYLAWVTARNKAVIDKAAADKAQSDAQAAKEALLVAEKLAEDANDRAEELAKLVLDAEADLQLIQIDTEVAIAREEIAAAAELVLEEALSGIDLQLTASRKASISSVFFAPLTWALDLADMEIVSEMRTRVKPKSQVKCIAYTYGKYPTAKGKNLAKSQASITCRAIVKGFKRASYVVKVLPKKSAPKVILAQGKSQKHRVDILIGKKP